MKRYIYQIQNGNESDRYDQNLAVETIKIKKIVFSI